MMYRSITQIIGNTPMLMAEGFKRELALSAELACKLEYLNPGGSVKDRTALGIIEAAEKRGELRAGMTVVEPTSGNTGISLAMIAAARGYKTVVTMPDTASRERAAIMRALGAEVITTDGKLGMTGAIARAAEIAAKRGGIVLGQFDSPANPDAHYRSTGPEIWADTDGKVAALVSAVGTGGTLTGTARFLKEQNGDIKIVAVEPQSSPVLSGGAPGRHKIQGIGAGFIPNTLELSLVDRIVTVSDEDAFSAAKLIARTDGVLVGISSGAALAAAARIASQPEFSGKLVAVILPDSADRYYSTELFS